MAQSSLGETDLLLIIEMCSSGIEKCDVREKEHLRANNISAAEWDRRVRERYLHLKKEIIAELEHRHRSLRAGKGEGSQSGARAKRDAEPPGK
jgi:hypothetical protein